MMEEGREREREEGGKGGDKDGGRGKGSEVVTQWLSRCSMVHYTIICTYSVFPSLTPHPLPSPVSFFILFQTPITYFIFFLHISLSLPSLASPLPPYYPAPHSKFIFYIHFPTHLKYSTSLTVTVRTPRPQPHLQRHPFHLRIFTDLRVARVRLN